MLGLRGGFIAYLGVIAAITAVIMAAAPAVAVDHPLDHAETIESPADEPVHIPELTPREAVVQFSEQYGADVALALCIVANESGFSASAKNPSSSAGGVWQFIDSTWVSTTKRMGKEWTLADKFDMLKNAEAGAWLLAHDGYTHWVVWPKCVGSV